MLYTQLSVCVLDWGHPARRVCGAGRAAAQEAEPVLQDVKDQIRGRIRGPNLPSELPGPHLREHLNNKLHLPTNVIREKQHPSIRLKNAPDCGRGQKRSTSAASLLKELYAAEGRKDPGQGAIRA